MTDLLARAEALQTEARQVLRRLDLEVAFPAFGPPQVVGSALSGLMAWRDLDVVFIAPSATADEVLAGLAKIAKAGGLLAADFRDERGDRRPTPSPTDERFYAVLRYEGATAVWKVDLTFWLHPIARPHVADADRLRAATPEQKLAILRLKDEHPGYPDEVGGTDIYNAVLDHGIRSTAELTAHLGG
ncbi:MAG TPA: hypothetical protein VFG33_01600 [Kribbella sp.]|uniref:hypothetical protein n=1 Tax=Kribbella sp. TaxID=1871183 RepID=UPI002D7A0430|nr:hypothetical protein [Kribbella sp.]HET6292028.1 hypothetical protein [Kribbella sp.]